jgi:hypothetical protein
MRPRDAAAGGAMSKHINVNPDHYKEAGREHQGEDIIHGNERNEFEHTRPGKGRGRPDEPHIPNQETASTPKPVREDERDSGGQPLTSDEGMVD